MVKVNPAERFWPKVTKTNGCWLWTGAKSREGYGLFRGEDRMRIAHRYAYELLVGPIPDGLTIDHLCRVRACVNPAHLEPVTNKVNVLRGDTPSSLNARKTHCLRGHPLAGDNLRYRADGHRECLTCYDDTQRRWQRIRRDRNMAPY